MNLKVNNGVKILLIGGLTITLGACSGAPKTVEVVQPATPTPTVTPEATPEAKNDYIKFDATKLTIENQMIAVDRFLKYQEYELNKVVTIEEINEMLELYRTGFIDKEKFKEFQIEALLTMDISEDTRYLIKDNFKYIEKDFEIIINGDKLIILKRLNITK